MSSRPVLLIDGLNLFMQHFVVNPTLSIHGNHVGGVVGFMKAVSYLSDRIGPQKIIIVWEGGGSVRKRSIYKGYKNGRRPQKLNRYYGEEIPDTVQNRDSELEMLIALMRSTPVTQLYITDCEADDIIGYVARHMYKDDRKVIVSSDKDLYQVLSKSVVQWSPGKKAFININNVKETFGIHVNNFCTARAFIGDPSDNLKGVPRVGFASLAKRFPELSQKEFVSVDQIIKKAEKMLENSTLKIYTNIVDFSDVPRRNWKLMYLNINNLSAFQIQKIHDSLDNKEFSMDKMKLIRTMMKYGINNFDADGFFASLRAITRRQ